MGWRLAGGSGLDVPYRDRERRLAYHREYLAKARPSPAPEPQRSGALPPRGILVVDDDGERVQCHECGRWFRGLQIHVRVHGLTAATYKERYDLARGLSLWSPAYQERQRQAAIARGFPDIGRAALAEVTPQPRPVGIPNRLSTRIAESRAHKGQIGTRSRDRPPPAGSASASVGPGGDSPGGAAPPDTASSDSAGRGSGPSGTTS